MKRRLAEIAIVIGLGLFVLGASGWSDTDAARARGRQSPWDDTARAQMALGVMVSATGLLLRRA